MAHQYVTAKKGTPEFEKLIRGLYSDKQIALPVQNLSVGTQSEEVTFELVNKNEIQVPSSFKVWKEFLPTKKLLYVLFPLFYFVTRDWARPQLSATEVLCLFFGLVFVLLAVQIKVDIEDFISGYDRVRGLKGQRVLHRGWKTASELSRDYKKFLIVAVVFALVPLVLEPRRVLAVLVAVLFVFVGYRWGISRRDRLVRDIVLSWIAGPCLAFGIVPRPSSLLFGFVWSFFAFFALQLEHFQHYLTQTQSGEKNLITMNSFDQAPQVIWSLWGLCLIVYAFMRSLTSQMAVWAGSVLIIVILSFRWKKSLFQLQSPAGSEIDKTVLAGHQLYYTFISLWVAELLFLALMAPLALAWFK